MKWEGKVENEDYVRCLECGHKSKSLARHIKSAHKMTADQYRKKHGADVLILSRKASSNRNKAIKKARKSSAYSGKKTVKCIECSSPYEVHKLAAAFLCPVCLDLKEKEKQSKWDDKVENQDYVVCLDCGYRGESLVSHINSEHPDYRKRHPDALIVALGSSIRDASHLRGKRLSAETRAKMSANAGRWNKGLKKEDHPSLMAASKKMKGRTSWSKGLTKRDHPSLQSTSDKMKLYIGENRPWSENQKVNLTLNDFAPFMDEEGCIDRKAITEATGLSWQCVYKYMKTYGLETSQKHTKARQERQIIRLEKEQLEPYCLQNGKLSVALAMHHTGHAFNTIKREASRHGIPTCKKTGQQTLCMDIISSVLGGIPYEHEWKSWKYVNPKTGWRFKFDAYFPDIGLVVEFQGHQHYIFPNAWMYKEEHKEKWHELLERDRIKRELIEGSELKYLEIRYDEPFTDLMYMGGRLFPYKTGDVK